MKKVIAAAALIAIVILGVTAYAISFKNKEASAPTADNKSEVATKEDGQEGGLRKLGADRVQNIFPKMISDKKIYSNYPDFEEVDGSNPGEVVLIAPCGAEISSSHGGVVTGIVNDGWNEGKGNYVTIETSFGNVFYTHLKDIFVRVGDMVEIGTKIGTAGVTGELPENVSCGFGIMK